MLKYAVILVIFSSLALAAPGIIDVIVTGPASATGDTNLQVYLELKQAGDSGNAITSADLAFTKTNFLWNPPGGTESEIFGVLELNEEVSGLWAMVGDKNGNSVALTGRRLLGTIPITVSASGQVVLDLDTYSSISAASGPDFNLNFILSPIGVACIGDNDCGNGVCSAGVCYDCRADGDCTEGICSSNQCVTCDANSGCTGQVCKIAPNAQQNSCVQCTSDSQCPDEKCDLGTNLCVSCLADTDCAGAYCLLAANSQDNRCAQCLSDSDCPTVTPDCVNNVCQDLTCQNDRDIPTITFLQDNTGTSYCTEIELELQCADSTRCEMRYCIGEDCTPNLIYTDPFHVGMEEVNVLAEDGCGNSASSSHTVSFPGRDGIKQVCVCASDGEDTSGLLDGQFAIYSNTCQGSQVQSYSCVDSLVQEEVRSCPTQQSCQQGECVEITSCSSDEQCNDDCVGGQCRDWLALLRSILGGGDSLLVKISKVAGWLDVVVG